MVVLQTVACGIHMVNCNTARVGVVVHRRGELDGLPASTICWWHPSRPSLLSQCEVPGADYIVLRSLLGDDSTSPRGWESQHCIQFLQVDDDVVEIAISQSPIIPR
eukprot:8824269-Lingulodinium_polyedra.AAC.1